MNTYQIDYKGNDGFEYSELVKAPNINQACITAHNNLVAVQRLTIETVDITAIWKVE